MINHGSTIQSYEELMRELLEEFNRDLSPLLTIEFEEQETKRASQTREQDLPSTAPIVSTFTPNDLPVSDVATNEMIKPKEKDEAVSPHIKSRYTASKAQRSIFQVAVVEYCTTNDSHAIYWIKDQNR